MSKPELTADEVRAMLEYCEQATPGPWAFRGAGREIIIIGEGGIIVCDPCRYNPQDELFATLSRTDLPRLARHALAQEQRIAALEAELKQHDLDNIELYGKLGLASKKIFDLEAELAQTRSKLSQYCGVFDNETLEDGVLRFVRMREFQLNEKDVELSRARRVVEASEPLSKVIRNRRISPILDGALTDPERGAVTDFLDALDVWQRGEQ